MCGIKENQANVFFQDAISESVSRLLHATHGTALVSQPEEILIENTRKIVMAAKSKYATIVELEAIKQQPDERAENFLAKLSTKARQVGFKKSAKCPCEPPVDVQIDYTEEVVLAKFLAGLRDKEIKKDLMKKATLELIEAVEMVTIHKMAERSKTNLSDPMSCQQTSSASTRSARRTKTRIRISPNARGAAAQTTGQVLSTERRSGRPGAKHPTPVDLPITSKKRVSKAESQ